MELAIQIISSDKTVRNDTVQDLKEFNCQSLSTQAKKREQIVSMMRAIGKDFERYSRIIYRKRIFEN